MVKFKRYPVFNQILTPKKYDFPNRPDWTLNKSAEKSQEKLPDPYVPAMKPSGFTSPYQQILDNPKDELFKRVEQTHGGETVETSDGEFPDYYPRPYNSGMKPTRYDPNNAIFKKFDKNHESADFLEKHGMPKRQFVYTGFGNRGNRFNSMRYKRYSDMSAEYPKYLKS